jgi:hypothetical protein
MVVRELIEKLKVLDPELRVFTKGYEGGYEDASFNDTISNFELDYYKEWWNGPHEMLHEEYPNEQTVKGIVL